MIVGVRYEEDYAVLLGETKTGKTFETKVDVDMVERLRGYSWYPNKYGYLVAQDPERPTAGASLAIQRLVMDARRGEVVDHKFGDPMDNRRHLLRLTNRQRNGFHRVKLSVRNTSGRTGVSELKSKKWVARIKVDYKTKSLGTFNTFDEAVAARVAAEKQYCGEFAPRA